MNCRQPSESQEEKRATRSEQSTGRAFQAELCFGGRLSQRKTQRVFPGASGKEESGGGRSKDASPVGDGGTGLYVNQSVVAEKWRHLWLSNPVPGAAATQISSIFNTVKLTLPYLLHRVVIRDEVEVKSCVCSFELVEDQHQGVHRE